MNGMELTLPFALHNPFPVECYTDHSPLKWVKHTGSVSQFIIDKLSLIDYNMHYIKGKDNIVADALSRFPMLGPGSLVRTGLSRAIDYLLAALVDTDINATKIDLAEAYIDMGDGDGARDILNEVLEEGSPEQKSRAQELLDGID